MECSRCYVTNIDGARHATSDDLDDTERIRE